MILFVLITGIYYNKLNRQYKDTQSKILRESQKQKSKINVEEFEEVVIYFPNVKFDDFEKSKEKILKEEDLKEKLNIILELIKEKTKNNINNSENKNLKFMDDNLQVENAYLDKEDLYVDFNMDFRKDFVDKNYEAYFVYSLVNSFTELPKIKRVKFIILGEEVKVLKFFIINGFFEKYKKI